MSKIKIYAAGAIGNTNYDGATGWYKNLREGLDRRYSVLTPMRGKMFLANAPTMKPLGFTYEAVSVEQHQKELISDNMIMQRDAWDVRRCDAVFMNLQDTPDKISIGCMMELGMAHAHRKPIILVVSPDDTTGILDHPMVRYTVTGKTDNFGDGVYLLSQLFSND